MPIIGTQNDEEGLDPNQQTHGAGTYSGPGGVSPSGGGSGFVGGSGQGSTTAPTAAGSSTAPTSSGDHYTNLLSYLGANQGSGATMGGAVGDVAKGVGQQASGSVGTYQQTGTQAAKDATVNFDPTKAAKGTAVDQGVMDKIAGGVTGGGVTKTTNADGSVTTNTAAKTYTGPDAPKIADPTMYTAPTYNSAGVEAATAPSKANAYSDLSRLAGWGKNADGSTSGSSALLGNIYNQPSYTSGEKTFDSAILGGTEGGKQGLAQVADTAKAGAAQGEAADRAVTDAGNAARATSQATGDAYTKAYNDATAMNSATQKAYQQAIDKARLGQTKASSLTSAPPPRPPAPPAPDSKLNPNANPLHVAVNAEKKGQAIANAAPSQAAGAGSPIFAGAGHGTFKIPSIPVPTFQPTNVQTPGAGALPAAAQRAPAASNAGSPINVVSQPVQKAADWISNTFADGGEVGDDDDKKPGLVETAGKLAPLVMMMMKSGGKVPGTAAVPGDSPKNDTVPAMLSAKEIVLPRSVTLAPDAPAKAAEFVAKIKKPGGYDALLKLCGGS